MTFISSPDGPSDTNPDILKDDARFYETVGKQIRRQRRHRELTQAQLASGLNIRFQQIQKYECGANKVSLYNYLRICAELPCGPASLLGFLNIVEHIAAIPTAIVDANKFYDRLGTELRRMRHKVDLTQTEVGDDIGVRFQQIQKYESGANKINMRRYFNMAGVCGVSPTEALKIAVAAIHNVDRDIIVIGGQSAKRFDRRS